MFLTYDHYDKISFDTGIEIFIVLLNPCELSPCIRKSLGSLGAAFWLFALALETCVSTGADTGGVDRVDIQPPFFSKKKFEMSLYLK